MQILSDLVHHISCDVQPSAVAPTTPCAENCFSRLRFEAAEARYGRMKALVCASLERLAQAERAAPGVSGLMENLRINGADNATVVWNTLNELKVAKEEIAKLKEMNHCLRSNAPMEMPLPMVVRDCKVECELQVARQQIGMLELELVRMSDQQFEIEERVREYQDVIDNLLGQEHTAVDPVHPRYHPISTCSSAACQNYAKRLRSGLRQAVADAYVRDRNVRIHGHCQTVIRPLEALRAEKDGQIRELQSRLARLECVTLRSADDVAAVNEEVAKAVCELEQVKAETNTIRTERDELQKQRGALLGQIQGLQLDIQEAKAILDEAKERSSLCKAEMHCLEKERERAQRVWERVQSFMGGQMGAEYDRMLQEYQTMERRLGVMREQGAQEEQADQMVQDDAPIKQVGKTVFITCKCGQSVPADDIGRHIISAHRAKDKEEIVACPHGCGFFAASVKEMVAHVGGADCVERVRAIKRLKESVKGV